MAIRPSLQLFDFQQPVAMQKEILSGLTVALALVFKNKNSALLVN